MVRATTETARLALETVLQRPTRGIPTFGVHLMEHAYIEHLAGAEPGSYRREPEKTYLAFKRAIGVCLLDQYIPENPLSMGSQGYEGERGATTGAEEVTVDGVLIDSPHAVVEHLERVEFPRIKRRIAEFDEDARVREIIEQDRRGQE